MVFFNIERTDICGKSGFKSLISLMKKLAGCSSQSCVLDRITFCMFGVRKPSLSSTFVVWLIVVLSLSSAGEMYRGIGERRSLSEENLRVSGRPRRNNVTLDVYAVNSEKVAVLRKQRGGYASNLTRKRDELKSLLDNGASVDRVQKRLEQARTALKDLYDFNVKLIQCLERAGTPEEVPSRTVLYRS